jgi:hypothetical protein
LPEEPVRGTVGAAHDREEVPMVQRSGAARAPSRSGAAASAPADDIRRGLANLVQIQVAGVLAGAGLLTGLIEMAAGLGDRMGRRTVPVVRGDGTGDRDELRDLCQELGGELERCLREMTQLPRIHGLRFYAELQRIREESKAARR